MKIQNARELAITPTREIMIRIAESAFESIDTRRAIEKACKKEGNVCSILGEEISQKGRFFICGAGKCSLEAGQELERIFRGSITDGFLIGTEPGTLNFITYQEGTHPFPSEKNKEATKALKEKISSLRLQEQDTVLCLISGGGSVLLSDGEVISIEKEEAMMKRLFEVGADITSMNTMRKHISSVRGGFLAKLLYPAKVISLIFSDVPGNNPSFISSGPTVFDTTTKEDAARIAHLYGVCEACGLEKEIFQETPKEKKYFERVKNEIIVSNEIALRAMKEEAELCGLETRIEATAYQGEAKILGKKMIKKIQGEKSKTALLFGGESTVHVKNKEGKGGRNLEMALGTLSDISENIAIITIASDGHDNCDFAGAICDIMSKEKAEQKNLLPEKFLEENKSYDFFEQTGDFLYTGKTGSNVSDLVAVFKF